MNIDQIVNSLFEIETFLSRHKVNYAETVAATRALLQNTQSSGASDAEKEKTLLNVKRDLFRGMGSLTDVYISRDNGHEFDNEERVNRELDTLTTTLWELFSKA